MNKLQALPDIAGCRVPPEFVAEVPIHLRRRAIFHDVTCVVRIAQNDKALRTDIAFGAMDQYVIGIESSEVVKVVVALTPRSRRIVGSPLEPNQIIRKTTRSHDAAV